MKKYHKVRHTELKLNEYPIIYPPTSFIRPEDTLLNQFGKDAVINHIMMSTTDYIEVLIYAS